MRSAFHLVTRFTGFSALLFVAIACGSPYGEDGDGEGPAGGTEKAGGPGGASTPNNPSSSSTSSGGGGGSPAGESSKVPGPVLLISDSGSRIEGWKFDGASWAQLATVNNPSTRRGFMTASLNGKVVLFGGYDPNTPGLAETWTLDHVKLAWTREAPTTSPPARYGAAMVTLRDKVILFGGVDNLMGATTRIHSDTWSWNGTTWKQEPGGPSARSGHAMATLKGGGDRVVLFGGANPSSRELDDTWIFESATGGWRALPSNVAHPPACFRCTMAPVGDSAVALVGPGLDTQTWVFDGATWSLKAATGPSRRISSMAAVAGPKIVLFGGYTNTVSNAHSDTWSFDGKEWTLLHPPSTPPATVCALGSLVPVP
jgi:hypothetical protein